jgi:SAM-dependent methyltransferase
VAHERLEDELARLDRELQDADRRYNETLTAVDHAIGRAAELPRPPAPYDESRLDDVNAAWNILPGGPPPVTRSLKGRLRSFVWRLVGPPLEAQRDFNAVVVDRLNRNAVAHRDAERTVAASIERLGRLREELIRFEILLVHYFQTITAYIDTKDRSVAGQVRVVSAGLNAIAEDWLKRWDSLAAREQRMIARVASADDLRATATLAQQTALTLKREVERLLETPPGPPGTTRAESPPPVDLDSFKYVGFEDAFRGSREDIAARVAGYLPLFTGASDVLDIGCGRGEFLVLLGEAGISARGLDLNHEMVEASRARGLDVAEGDALGYLRGLPDGSLGGLFSSQVVEHLQPDYLMRVLEAAFHALRPGTVIALETINPACWLAFFESYIRDLTHVRPLHPDTLQYLMRASGFQDVRVEYTSPVDESAKLQLLGPAPSDASVTARDLVETINENVAKLNARLFTYQDYAVIARR